MLATWSNLRKRKFISIVENYARRSLYQPIRQPPQEVRRSFASLYYRAQSLEKPRRVVAKRLPRRRLGSNGTLASFTCASGPSSPAWRGRPSASGPLQSARHPLAVHQGGKGRGQTYAAVIPHLRRQRRPPPAPCAGLQLGNFMPTLALPKAEELLSLTSLCDQLIKIGPKVVSHGRYVTFEAAEVAVLRQMFLEILMLITRLQAPPAPA